MSARPVIAIIGAGAMGSNHARTITESDIAKLGVVIDLDADAAARLADRHWVPHTSDLAAALRADAVIVATATASHREVAEAVIDAGIPTLIEKPVAPTLADVDAILDVALARGTPVMCGFVERFNPAVRTAIGLIEGPVRHITTVRHSPLATRIRSSVVSDLLLHDLDLVLRVAGNGEPKLVGSGTFQPEWSGFSEIVDCTLDFGDGLATLSANRMSQRKVRAITIQTEHATIEVDLLRQDVTVYRHVSHEIAHQNGGQSYRSSTEIEIPFVRQAGEPLALQLAHFVSLFHGRGDADREREGLRPAHVLMQAIEQT